jgi:hypothetical protein
VESLQGSILLPSARELNTFFLLCDHKPVDDTPLVFAYSSPMSMHYCQQGAVKPNVYVVTCKKCTRSIPAGAQEFPRGNLVVQCPLCGELRRYRPSEVYLGFPDSHLVQQQVSITRRRKGGW